jgi:hypothetical protein
MNDEMYRKCFCFTEKIKRVTVCDRESDDD